MSRRSDHIRHHRAMTWPVHDRGWVNHSSLGWQEVVDIRRLLYSA
jgi:hypothetical protein